MGDKWVWVAVAVAVAVVQVQSDRGGSSLRGALEALQRRQRGRVRGPIGPQPDYDTLYEFVPPSGYPEPDYSVDVDDVEIDNDPNSRYVVKYLDEKESRDPEPYAYKLIKKKKSHYNEINSNKPESPFRERTLHTSDDKLRDLFMDNSEFDDKKDPETSDKDAEYALLLGQLWSKYKYNKANAAESAPQGVVKLYKEKVVKKRYPDNWGPIAFKRKRSSDSEGDRPILSNYEEKKIENDGPNLNYNGLDINDDDKDDMREEYAIAFQPLDDDSTSDLANDQYIYDAIEKRFPVAKRSSGSFEYGSKKRNLNQKKRDAMKAYRSSSGTNPKIIKDLSKIFGSSPGEITKKTVKRSSDLENNSHDSKPPTLLLQHNHTEEHVAVAVKEDNSHEHHDQNIHHPGISAKEIEVDPEQTHTYEHVPDQLKDSIKLKKKSIDWSDYFGIDKRLERSANGDVGTKSRLRNHFLNTFNNEVITPLESFRGHRYSKRNLEQNKPNDESAIDQVHIENDEKGNTASSDSKLENIDRKLKNMEGFIVDEALHFSNTGEELDSKEEQEMKEKLLSRLAAAYSLEKMRKALKEFKQNLQSQRSEDEISTIPIEEVKTKRVAVKKELLNNEIPFVNKEEKSDDFEDEQGAGHYVNGNVEEQLSEGYMGGSGRHQIPVVSSANADGSCPVLSKIVQRCRGVDVLSGDRGQLFLPLCSLHQICYLCGEAPPTTCDLVFLSEADSSCEGNMSCQRAARTALMSLRELHDNLADELDGECETSPCLPATLKLNVSWLHALQR